MVSFTNEYGGLFCSIQKQPFADVLQNSYFKNFRNIHRKTPVLESLSNKVAALKAYNFIKNWLQHKCFLVNIAIFLKLAFYIEHLWWLLLQVAVIKNSCSEKQLFRKKAISKIASLIDNLKRLLWKGTVPHDNYSGTNSKNLWGVPFSSFIFGRVAQKQPRRCSKKKSVYKISQNSQGNTCARVFLRKSDSITDFKNILQVNHKDTQITFLKHSFFVDFEHVFVC